MSEEERIELSDKITQGIRNAQRKMLERKAKLGENVVVGDSKGEPHIMTAREALDLLREENR